MKFPKYPAFPEGRDVTQAEFSRYNRDVRRWLYKVFSMFCSLPLAVAALTGWWIAMATVTGVTLILATLIYQFRLKIKKTKTWIYG